MGHDKKSLWRIRTGFISVVESCHRHHRLTLAVVFIIPAVLMALYRPLDVLLSVDELIDRKSQVAQNYFASNEEFNLHQNATIIFEKQDARPFSSNELCDLKKWVSTEALANPGIVESHSPLSMRRVELSRSKDGFATLGFPLLVPLDCEGAEVPVNLAASLARTPWNNLLARADGFDFIQDYQLTGEDHHELKTEELVPLVEKLKQAALRLPDTIKTHWVGSAGYQYEMDLGIKYNSWLNLPILLILVVGLRIVFGTWLSGLLFCGTLAYSMGIILGLMSLAGAPMDMVNNTMFLLLAVSSLGDFVFVSHHALSDKGDGLESFKALALSCFFTSFTTFIGFFSLCTSDVEIVRRFGIWAGLSGLIEWVAVFLILPALLKVCLRGRSWVRADKAINIVPWDTLGRLKIPTLVSKFLVAIVFLGPFSLMHLNVSDLPNNLFRPGNPFRESIEYLFNTRGFKGEVSLILNDKDAEEFNKTLMARITSLPNVVKVESPYDSLDYYTRDLNEGQRQVVERGLKQTSQFKRFVSAEKLRAVVYLKEVELSDIDRMRIMVEREFCPKNECVLTGVLVAYAEFAQQVPQTLISSFTMSFVLVLIVLVYLAQQTNNLRRLPAIVLTGFWGVGITLLVIGLFQVRINFATSVVLSILVGMTGDNSIQFVLGGMDKDLANGIQDRATPAVVTSCIMMVASCVFFLNYFDPPRVIGALLITCFFMALAGDLWLLKGLLGSEKSQE